MYVVANEVTKAHGEACDKASNSLNSINNNAWEDSWAQGVDNHCEEHQDDIDEGMKAFEQALFVAIAIVVILPIVYIYWWVVVNSLRKSIVMRNMGVLPMHQQPVMLIQQQPNTMPPVGY